MKKTILLILSAVLAIIVNSCGDSGGSQVILPNLSGSSGEVLVVLDKAKWEGPLGHKIREVLGAPVPKLPQAEPYFDLVNTSPGAFSKLYQTHRNVLFVETGEDKVNQVSFLENTYSYLQLMINLQGKNDEELMKLLDEKGQTIINKLNIAERDRWISVYKKSLNSMIFNNLRDKHKMNLHMPANFALDVDEKGFLWFSYETPTTTQAILVHYFDHKGKNYFNKDSIMKIRDNMTREKVEGPVSGSYMAIEDQVPVDFQLFRFRQRNYAEMRGLWTLENGFMGGPFITLVTKDEVNDRFVMLDGFVYAPNDEKRELLRQVEAIIYTISFPDDSEVVVTPKN
ncbi:MAG TPA: DUF4837 family protein [Bacteroidetes bacterium]|nr:DUF4837 family protein [Bacteroidota bacterium]